MWLKRCVLTKTNIFTLSAAWHTTPSLMIPPSLSTSSLLTRTPIRLSTRPSTGPPQISYYGETRHCDDPINVSFGSLADLYSPTLSSSSFTFCLILVALPRSFTCARRLGASFSSSTCRISFCISSGLNAMRSDPNPQTASTFWLSKWLLITLWLRECNMSKCQVGFAAPVRNVLLGH